MWSSSLLSLLLVASSTLVRAEPITPKVFIINLFTPEADVWLGPLNLTVHNITVPGLSPLYPQAHCNERLDICQATMGEAEINAATSMTSLWHSQDFDLSQTYFLVAGIAGVNPNRATLGAAAFALYAVQFGLEYEIDAREIPANFSTGYFGLGTFGPGQYPTSIYGTEVFKLNDVLVNHALNLASNVTLVDSPVAAAYRARYPQAAAQLKPSILQCDTGTSDVYWSGDLLEESFDAYATMMSNGSARYCMTQEEDNAVLESIVRGTVAKRVDFTRVLVLRGASDFDRQPPNEEVSTHLLYDSQGGFEISLSNLFLAGGPFVNDVIDKWDTVYRDMKGLQPSSYYGDILGTLGGTPTFGPSKITSFKKRRSLRRRSAAAGRRV